MSSYRVHKFNIKMSKDQDNPERFLNSFDGEMAAIARTSAWGSSECQGGLRVHHRTHRRLAARVGDRRVGVQVTGVCIGWR